jgi:ABC-2 type transport system ATP-binding protein
VREVVRARHSGRQLTLLVRTDGYVVDPGWSVDEIGLEELLLAYMAPEELAPSKPTDAPRLRWHG